MFEVSAGLKAVLQGHSPRFVEIPSRFVGSIGISGGLFISCTRFFGILHGSLDLLGLVEVLFHRILWDS